MTTLPAAARITSGSPLARTLNRYPLAAFPYAELTAANENAFIAASLESTLSQLAAQIDLELRYRSDGDSMGPGTTASPTLSRPPARASSAPLHAA